MKVERSILVTGSTGQVGHELVRSLQGLGSVLAPTRRELDLSNPSSIRAFVKAHRPTTIVNPAAYTAVDKAEADRAAAFAINAEAVAVLAEEARHIGAAVIHYSTDYVFSGTKTSAYVEDDGTGPINVYGESKLAGENALAESGVPYLTFRTSWVYGARGANFLLTMLKLARDNDELRIVADQIGAPTWSRTIADLTAHIVAQGIANGDLGGWVDARKGTYHLTATGAASWADFAEAIFELSGVPKRPRVETIATSEFPRPAARPLNSQMSTDKLKRVFQLQPPDWRDALQLCLGEIASRE